MNWINVNDQLPSDRRCVLVHVLRNNWKGQREDSLGIYYVVAWIERGISQETRRQMRDGLLPDPEEIGLTFWDDVQQTHRAKRSKVTRQCDEDGNNLRPYCWHTFGPAMFFGQEVDFWCEIPRLPVTT